MRAAHAFGAEQPPRRSRTRDFALVAAAEPELIAYGDYLYGEWLPALKLDVQATTYQGCVGAVTNHIAPVLGDVSVSAITNRMLKAFYRDLLTTPWKRSASRTLSRGTVVTIHSVVGWSLQGLVDAGRLPANPAWGARPRMRKSDRHEPVTWTPDQVCEFLDYSNSDELAALWNLLVLTGMTRGESLGLHWSDVAPGYTHVNITRSLMQAARSTYVKEVRPRRIDLLDSTKVALRALRRSELRRRRSGEISTDDFIFCDAAGGPLKPDLPTRRFRSLAEAGAFTRIRLCDLRHTHASHLLEAGANIKAVQERLGHANPMFTIDTYVHTLPTIQAEAVKALTKFYGEVTGPKS